ncbi:hypothetical protein NDU88_005435 [Pleurodeles waltl]|uniref:Uncharacterized protein n=1 Tax=Pleurodeles waltl TaxID=8319 RepID=A0AAV7UJ94_PLEWA|nr:hypothetical protein NDU88_005435 [Pleurodeles waltl]
MQHANDAQSGRSNVIPIQEERRTEKRDKGDNVRNGDKTGVMNKFSSLPPMFLEPYTCASSTVVTAETIRNTRSELRKCVAVKRSLSLRRYGCCYEERNATAKGMLQNTGDRVRRKVWNHKRRLSFALYGAKYIKINIFWGRGLAADSNGRLNEELHAPGRVGAHGEGAILHRETLSLRRRRLGVSGLTIRGSCNVRWPHQPLLIKGRARPSETR